MQKFGEMCIATYRDNTSKFANQGTPGIWVGYVEGDPPGIHKVFNPTMKKIILTQDVSFLQKSYCEYTNIEKPFLLTTSDEGSDDEEDLKPVPIFNDKNNVKLVTDSDSEDETNKDNKTQTKILTTKSSQLISPNHNQLKSCP